MIIATNFINGNLLFFNPIIVEYSEHEDYCENKDIYNATNTYVAIELNEVRHLICRVEKIFWKFYKQVDREFFTWECCVSLQRSL